MSAKRPFFITGLPRCRSAWMATLLTHGDTICLHDVFIPGITPDNIGDWFPLEVRGISDPCCVFHWERLVKLYPQARWTVILRDFDDTIHSCQQCFPTISEEWLWMMLGKLQALQTHVSCITVDNTLDPETCFSIAHELGVDIGSPMRVSQLCRMNIQLDPKIMKSEIERLTKGMKHESLLAA